MAKSSACSMLCKPAMTEDSAASCRAGRTPVGPAACGAGLRRCSSPLHTWQGLQEMCRPVLLHRAGLHMVGNAGCASSGCPATMLLGRPSCKPQRNDCVHLGAWHMQRRLQMQGCHRLLVGCLPHCLPFLSAGRHCLASVADVGSQSCLPDKLLQAPAPELLAMAKCSLPAHHRHQQALFQM